MTSALASLTAIFKMVPRISEDDCSDPIGSASLQDDSLTETLQDDKYAVTLDPEHSEGDRVHHFSPLLIF